MRVTGELLALATAALAATPAACLLVGPPPAGRQIVADRQASLGAIVPPNGDGVLRVLILRPAPGTDAADLSVVSVDAAGSPSPERPLVSDINASTGLGCTWKVAPCAVDASGWVTVYKDSGGPVSVNAITGEIADSNTSAVRLVSASRQRSFVEDTTSSGTLVDADGSSMAIQSRATSLSEPPPYAFGGDDFYYIDAENDLIDVPPSGVAEQMASDVSDFRAWLTPDGVLLILIRATSDPGVTQSSVRDPVTGVETPLPFAGSAVYVAPDGQWLVGTGSSSSGKFTFFNYRSGVQQTADIGEYAQFPAWRPATSELWVTGIDATETPTLWILRPDAPAVSLPGVALTNVSIDKGIARPFTPDGAEFFSTTSGFETSTPVLQVGPGDDPTAPRFDLNAPETDLDTLWELPDGRVMTAFFTKSNQRSDVIAIDPRTGDRQVLAERGLVAAIGQTRFMGMFHYTEGRGDLTIVELASGRQTILAPEFTVTAFAEPQGTDLLAAGTRIVYQFQARTSSPDDGIWVVTCP